MSSFPIIIAIDGPAASGKGTVARRLASHLGYAHLDTGLLYRAVGLAVQRMGKDPADPQAASEAANTINTTNLADDSELRSDEASVAASKVAAIPVVRSSLLAFQKNFCLQPPHDAPGAVLDGRDIGTVIAPDARVKIYVTASLEIRAQRRLKELQGRGQVALYEDILRDMQERDARDEARAVAPAKPAPDAILLDTSLMTADEAFAAALQIVKTKL